MNIQLIETHGPVIQNNQEYNGRSQKSMKAKGLRSSKFSGTNMSNVTSEPDNVARDPESKQGNVIVNISNIASRKNGH